MGNIAKRPNGAWRARYRDESGREHSKHFTRKGDAQRWLEHVAASRIAGNYVDPSAGRISFSAFYLQWADRQVWASNTRRAMDLAAGSVPFGDVPLRTVRRSHIEQWIKSMLTITDARPRPLAASTIHTRVNNVRAVLRAAVADQVIAKDPSQGIRLPRRRKRDAAMRIPQPGEVGALLEHAEPSFKAFVAVCAFAGLRLGEAAALKVSDVDFLHRRLSVERQVQRAPKGSVEIRPPKYGSERQVILPDGLLDLLGKHVGTHVSAPTPDGWLFTSLGSDLPPHQNTIGHRWRSTLKAAGLTGIKLHDLRHFYASGLIAAGCDVVTVQRALGHSSATTTLSTYAHLWPNAEDRTRSAAAEMLAQAVKAHDESRTA